MSYTTVLTAKSTINNRYVTVFVRIDRKTGIAEIDEKAYRSLKNKLIHWEFDNVELRALGVLKVEYK